MTITLRRLTEKDAHAAQELYQQLFENNAVGSAQDFSRLLGHDGTSVWGAFECEALASMATLHVLPNMTYAARPYAVVENVVTRDSHRGQGIGQKVMRAIIDAAWDAGAYKIMLQTGRARGAPGFYESLGFDGNEKHGMVLRRLNAQLPTT